MICSYHGTVKYVNIKDARLATLRTLLLIVIVAYVGVFEMWAQGGWLEASPVVGVVRFSLQQPTVNNCNPNNCGDCQNDFLPLSNLSYCRQGVPNSSYYAGTIYNCEIYEATNAQIVSEKSMTIITRASTRDEELVCTPDQMICPRTYNQTTSERKFYTAESESFTILFDHAVTAAKICNTHNNYACSTESSQYQGRLHSRDHNLCAEAFAKGNAYMDARGDKRRASSPCYIGPNTTSQGQDFLSLGMLLKAVGLHLDACNEVLSNSTTTTNSTGECHTYRETGGTILLNIFWTDFAPYRGVVEPHYYYSPQFLSGSSFKQSIPYYHSYRSSRTVLNAHGIRVAVLLGGEYHQFDVISFLVTLTTAVGLLAVATTIVDVLMLYILPEKKRYQQAKYEEEEGSEEILDDGQEIPDESSQPDSPPLEPTAGNDLEGNTINDELREPLLHTNI